ncbi:DUF3027 domain-containing protein [Agromyces sp. NPDC049794]|uniref:DUF3027 domain-containing protein n=1 Tax=unclassified Agromyces TaxID=2639701 RepID=UPI0033D79894
MPEPFDQPEQLEPAAEPAETVAEPTETVSTDAAAPAPVADEVLLGAVDFARRALLEVTRPETVGSVVGHVVEGEHVLTLLFASDLSGYPGWHWSVTIARIEDAEPTVLETELMPGDRALLAPEWVPWSERLADYRAAQEAIAAAAADAAGETVVEEELDDEADDFDDDDLDEDEVDDEAELDAAFGRDAGDDEFDGIDIDSLDESAEDDDTEDDDTDDDDTDDDGSDVDEDGDDSDADQSAVSGS